MLPDFVVLGVAGLVSCGTVVCGVFAAVRAAVAVGAVANAEADTVKASASVAVSVVAPAALLLPLAQAEGATRLSRALGTGECTKIQSLSLSLILACWPGYQVQRTVKRWIVQPQWRELIATLSLCCLFLDGEAGKKN